MCKSRRVTLKGRSLDIQHLAAALTLGARVFVSFDDRQRKAGATFTALRFA